MRPWNPKEPGCARPPAASTDMLLGSCCQRARSGQAPGVRTKVRRCVSTDDYVDLLSFEERSAVIRTIRRSKPTRLLCTQALFLCAINGF